jgi:hypothetical protein
MWSDVSIMQVARIIVRDIELRPHMMRAPSVLAAAQQGFLVGGSSSGIVEFQIDFTAEDHPRTEM